MVHGSCNTKYMNDLSVDYRYIGHGMRPRECWHRLRMRSNRCTAGGHGEDSNSKVQSEAQPSAMAAYGRDCEQTTVEHQPQS